MAIIAPASGLLEPSRLDRGVAELEGMGLEVVLGPHVREVRGYLAGGDRGRAEDLLWALGDPEVDAVWCARGGYGAGRFRFGEIVFGIGLGEVSRLPPFIFCMHRPSAHITAQGSKATRMGATPIAASQPQSRAMPPVISNAARMNSARRLPRQLRIAYQTSRGHDVSRGPIDGALVMSLSSDLPTATVAVSGFRSTG